MRTIDVVAFGLVVGHFVEKKRRRNKACGRFCRLFEPLLLITYGYMTTPDHGDWGKCACFLAPIKSRKVKRPAYTLESVRPEHSSVALQFTKFHHDGLVMNITAVCTREVL